ncbi:MAG: alanyl-tRNA editing protein [Clostridiales bacterium]|nr:alanyl-tRNA editing protein [Clostridiales bacterium]
MTDRIYENNSYIKEFRAQVVACLPAGEAFSGWQDGEKGAWAVVLDQTAFFPEGGGQSADTGRLFCGGQSTDTGRQAGKKSASQAPGGNEQGGTERAPGGFSEKTAFKVYDVQIKDGTVYHRTDLFAGKGTQILGKIDWEGRFSNMQQHSGEHIFSGLVHRHFGYDNVGFHLGSQAVTMDFNGLLTSGDIDRIEWEVNEAIYKNVPITVSYPDEEALKTMAYRSKIEIQGQVRIVTVEGYDVCACCAPHVARTGEIGILKVVDVQKYKGGVRVSILCGGRALLDYRKKQVQGQNISRLLSAPEDGISQAAERQLEENSRLRQKIYEMTRQLIIQKIEAIPKEQENIWFFEAEMDANTMRKTVNMALDRVSGYGGVFCGDDASGYKYIIGTKTKDALKAAKVLKERFEARGGGKEEMVQGYVSALRKDIEGALYSL